MYHFINLLIWLTLSVQSCNNYSKKEKDPLKLNIEYNNSIKPIAPLLHGASTSSMYWQTNARDEKFFSIVDSLHLNVLRWPGGTQAQFYHWNKPGYGFNFDEIKKIHPGYANSLKNQKAYVDENTSSRRYIDDFIQLAKSTKSEVLLCANVLTATDAETIDLLKFLQSNQIKIAGVELGNENYLPTIRGVFNSDVNQYIKRVEQLANKIKTLYPDMPVAVCAAPIRDIADENPAAGTEAAFFKDWNLQLAKHNFYDAVVLHYYFPIDCSGSLESDFICAAQQVDDIAHRILPESLNQYQNIFGSNKKFWITEWNIATKKTNGRFGNTMLQGIFIQRFYDALHAYNASHSNQINMATYQTLAGDIIGSCMIMDKTNRESYNDPQANPYIRRMAYYNHWLNGPLYQASYSYCNVMLNRNDVEISAYYNPSDKKLLISFSNSGAETVPLSEVLFDQKNIDGNTPVKINSIQSSALYDGFGNNKADGNMAQRQIPQLVQKTDALKNISISKYSFGYLQLSL